MEYLPLTTQQKYEDAMDKLQVKIYPFLKKVCILSVGEGWVNIFKNTLWRALIKTLEDAKCFFFSFLWKTVWKLSEMAGLIY